MGTLGGHHNGHNGVYHEADEAIDALYAWFPPQKAPQPCYEALFSLTLKGRLNGQEALLTARGMTPEEFRRNLESIKGLLDPLPQPTPAPAPSQGEGYCAAHQVHMKWNTGKDGKPGWWSHRKEDGTWCKGRS